jgi:hypothetical protein
VSEKRRARGVSFTGMTVVRSNAARVATDSGGLRISSRAPVQDVRLSRPDPSTCSATPSSRRPRQSLAA